MDIERERMDYDVVVVGAGPAGLASAIRLRQRAEETGEDLSVVVVEKGSEVGAHILSGAVVDPIGLDSLLPDWRTDETCPMATPVARDVFQLLGPAGALSFPGFLLPPMMHNEGNYVGSLGNLTRWLGERAEALGVEIYPGFPAADLKRDDNGAVVGIVTGDFGVDRDGTAKDTFTPGIELCGKYVVLAEGARGSLTKKAISAFALDKGREPQKFGLGMKELWRVSDAVFEPGLVMHTMGWPLGNATGGGSFLYHYGENQMALGLVVHLNYKNPHLDPYMEFQRLKSHPVFEPYLEGAKREGYGARAISEGGWQSVPKLAFPGGCLAGCAAGFVNVPRIKGSHNAVLSGILAADHIAAAIADGRANDTLESLEAAWRGSAIGQDLRAVRNVKPLWSKLGTAGGLIAGGLDMWANRLLGGSLFGTMSHGGADHEGLKAASDAKPITYLKHDGATRFDRASSVYLSNTNHEEDQPIHLHVRDLDLQKTSEYDVYAGPSARYCPAGVYEWQTNEDGAPRFVINAQNCVHCKTCDIKDPNQNIDWVPPEGGGGPNYIGM